MLVIEHMGEHARQPIVHAEHLQAKRVAARPAVMFVTTGCDVGQIAALCQVLVQLLAFEVSAICDHGYC